MCRNLASFAQLLAQTVGPSTVVAKSTCWSKYITKCCDASRLNVSRIVARCFRGFSTIFGIEWQCDVINFKITTYSAASKRSKEAFIKDERTMRMTVWYGQTVGTTAIWLQTTSISKFQDSHICIDHRHLQTALSTPTKIIIHQSCTSVIFDSMYNCTPWFVYMLSKMRL